MSVGIGEIRTLILHTVLVCRFKKRGCCKIGENAKEFHEKDLEEIKKNTGESTLQWDRLICLDPQKRRLQGDLFLESKSKWLLWKYQS